MDFKKLILIVFFPVGCFLNAQTIDTEGGHEKWEYVLEDTGDILQIALPVSAGFITLLEKDYEGTKQLALSYGSTLALTYALKYAIRKQRPEGRLHYDSFPSGHTSSAFSGASFLQQRYGWKYGLPAYFLASITAISRMEGPDGYHDLWDVLGGAFIGIGSTYIFTKPYQKEQFQIGFAANKDVKMVTFLYKF
ncbi:MAG: phosphatase PAP2 family protein [Muricauda sp.]|nr:phosphatase PAP2 family protein [Allomuricauda sp.]